MNSEVTHGTPPPREGQSQAAQAQTEDPPVNKRWYEDPKMWMLIISALIAVWSNRALAMEIVPIKHIFIANSVIPAIMLGWILAGAASENPQGGLKRINGVLWGLAMFLGFVVFPAKAAFDQGLANTKARMNQQQQARQPAWSGGWTQAMVSNTPRQVVPLTFGEYKVEFRTQKCFRVTTDASLNGSVEVTPNREPQVNWITLDVSVDKLWLIADSPGNKTFPVLYRIWTREYPGDRWRSYTPPPQA